jgi:hypothetical protein
MPRARENPLSRKYYVEIASILKEVGDSSLEEKEEVIAAIAGQFANFAKGDNPRFDRSTFMKAAGVGRQNPGAWNNALHHGLATGPSADPLAEALYELSLEGVDEEVGDSSEGAGWMGIMRSVMHHEIRGGDELLEGLPDPISVVITEDSQGFKDVYVYDLEDDYADEHFEYGEKWLGIEDDDE